MEFTRHARNEMRLYSINEKMVEATVAHPTGRSRDSRGNVRLVREIDGRAIIVISPGMPLVL